MKTTSCTEKKYYAFDAALRCGARTKSNNGSPCRYPAIKGRSRCRVHGGMSSGAPLHNVNALKHGDTTAEAKAFRKEIKHAIQLSKQSIEAVEHAHQVRCNNVFLLFFGLEGNISLI